MTAAHLDRVVEIERIVNPAGWSVGMFQSELSLPTTRAYVVANIDGELVGYGGITMAGDQGHVTTVAVDAVVRRHGVGTRIVVHLIAEILVRGGTEATLEVEARNRSAQALYMKFGFAPVGVRRSYYPRTGEDAIIMTVSAIDSLVYCERVRRIASQIVGRTVAPAPFVPPVPRHEGG